MGNEGRSPLLSGAALACEGFDDLPVLGELFCQGDPVGQLELCKIETRRHRAAYQCIFAVFGGYGGEPAACLYHELKMFSFFDVGSQPVNGEGA